MAKNKRIGTYPKFPRKHQGLWLRRADGSYLEVKPEERVGIQGGERFVTSLPKGAIVVTAKQLESDIRQLTDRFDEIIREFKTTSGPAMDVVRGIREIAAHPLLGVDERHRFLQESNYDDLLLNRPRIERMFKLIQERAVDPPVVARQAVARPEPELDLKVTAEAEADLLQWCRNPSPRLESNDCSRLHKLLECVQSVLHESADFTDLKTFVVRHDWATAMAPSLGEIQADELQMPYPSTAWEFRISGRTLIVIAADRRVHGGGLSFLHFAEAKNGFWIALTDALGDNPVMGFALRQVQSIAVMLDSQVAEHELVRQPTALQQKRERQGKIPLYDYRVIDLSRRHRAARNPEATPTGRQVRCHFRRGHWRHYQDHRTWIQWMLVGNPDLGFVDKEYRL